MSQDVQVQILGVTVRQTSRGSVYDVACNDGVKRQVWEAPLANALNAHVNQTVWLRVNVSQTSKNGTTYTNHSIQAFAPPGQQLPADGNAQQAAPMGGQQLQPAPTAGSPIQQAPPILPSQPTDNMPPNTITRITKLACIDSASNLVGQLLAGAGPEAAEQAEELVGKFAKTFYGMARAHEKPPVTTETQMGVQGQVVPPTPATPAEVAAQVPGVTVGAPVSAPVAEPAPSSSGDIAWD